MALYKMHAGLLKGNQLKNDPQKINTTVSHKVLPKILLVISVAMVSQQVMGHGYINSPESRAYLCKQGVNSNCGPVVYEPQSLEGPSRFPENGPADGEIASAGLAKFAELNEQNGIRWEKVETKSGAVEFKWTLTAAHATRDFRYFITKKDWDPNQPLTRDSFESVPFCSKSYNGERPPANASHLCTIPADRSGYNMVLGVWQIADTSNSFYQVIDLNIEGDVAPTPGVMKIEGLKDTYFIDQQGQLKLDFSIVTSEGQWASHYFVYDAFNNQIDTKSEIITSGRLDVDKILPALISGEPLKSGTYSIRLAGSEYNDQEATETDDWYTFEAKLATEVIPEIGIEGIKDSYTIDDAGQIEVGFNINTSEGNWQAVSRFYDDTGSPISNEIISNINTGSHHVHKVLPDMAGVNLIEGRYHLNVVGKFLDDPAASTVQKHAAFDVVGAPVIPEPDPDYNYIFPEKLSSYKAGSRVFQPKTNQVYECVSGAPSGYCVQYLPSANQFEPGVGSHWQMAWFLAD